MSAAVALEPSAPLLSVEDLHVHLGQSHVLQGVSFDVADGGVTALLGRNGVGKTTTIRAILGLVGRRGRIVYGGDEIQSLATHRIVQRDIGYVPEDRDVFAGLTVEENLRLAERSAEPRYDLVHDLFPELKERARQRAGTLSGGQQQRVAIARAMMQQPKVLLADEPIASLDPLNAKVVMDSLRDINEREGITVVTNLHTLDTARAYCHRIIGMAAGKVVFDGAPEDLDREAVRTVYGADANGVEISEAITSTTVNIKPKIIASAGPLEPAFPGY